MILNKQMIEFPMQRWSQCVPQLSNHMKTPTYAKHCLKVPNYKQKNN